MFQRMTASTNVWEKDRPKIRRKFTLLTDCQGLKDFVFLFCRTIRNQGRIAPQHAECHASRAPWGLTFFVRCALCKRNICRIPGPKTFLSGSLGRIEDGIGKSISCIPSKKVYLLSQRWTAYLTSFIMEWCLLPLGTDRFHKGIGWTNISAGYVE